MLGEGPVLLAAIFDRFVLQAVGRPLHIVSGCGHGYAEPLTASLCIETQPYLANYQVSHQLYSAHHEYTSWVRGPEQATIALWASPPYIALPLLCLHCCRRAA